MVERTKTKTKVKILIPFISLLLISGCANQLPPGGGEVDTTPPKIEEFYPANGSINFNDDFISFDFSEYVDKNSFKDAVFISPQINGELKYNWSGTNVSIEFPEKLKTKTTYVVTIGTDAADVHNRNKMAQSFTLTFSTGNEIDKRSITGKVYDSNPSGVMIFAYKITDNEIDPEKIKPYYVTQTGNDGSYKLEGITKGIFRLFAVRDKFKDFLFQPKQDDIGISSSEIYFDKNDTTVNNMNFKLINFDKDPPRLLKAIMTDEHHLLVEFTEALSPSSIKSENFYIIDSTLNEELLLKSIYAKDSKNKIVLINENKIDGNSNLFFIAKNIEDQKGNITTEDAVNLIYSNRTDTTKPKLVSVEPPNGNDNSDFSGQEFKFYFSDYFDTTLAKEGIKFVNSENLNIPFKMKYSDNASFKIIPSNDLLPVKDYKVILDLNKFKNQNGTAADSNYVYNFTTMNGLNFSGITGEVKNIETDFPIYIIIEGVGYNKLYKQLLSNNKKFVFNRVLAGKYNLWCFIDSDKNEEYTFGSFLPYKSAEQFIYLNSVLELKPRWMQTDIILEPKN
ncbi:MAG: hypothetical protein CO128_02945 [Ignavibacteriales bacterium CG_4_9_14_3_um_filter_30_11]|nr:MAG: hypothetical protein CO128_02945 [Ignavibacteriales bacterium CG_4_9_14_3_um_filter_30_11]